VNKGGGRQFSTEFQMDGMNVAYQGVTAGVPLDMRPDYDITSEVKVQIGVPVPNTAAVPGRRHLPFPLRHQRTAWKRHIPGEEYHPGCTGLQCQHRWNRPAVGATAFRRRAGLYPQNLQWQEQNLFFFNYTAFRQKPGGNPSTVTLPTAQERTGNFSDVATPIYDPTTGLPFRET